MRCLVTGAAGFIGSHLCERLIADGHEVWGVDDLSGGREANLSSIIDNERFHFVHIGLSETWFLRSGIPRSVGWFFHLAAKADIVPSIIDPLTYHDTNVTGTVRMLELARDLKVKHFLYAASSSCYGEFPNYPTHEQASCQPRYPYALSKYLGEQAVMHWSLVYGLPTTSLRLFNVYGPRSRTSGAYGAVFGVFLAQLANGKPFTVVGDGEQRRDFTFVTDVVEAFVRAAEGSRLGIMNIGTGHPVSVNKLVSLLNNPAGRITVPERPGEPKMTFAATSLAQINLGWEPEVSFEQGVRIMLNHLADYKDAPVWTKESVDEATKDWFKYLGG